MGLRDDFLSVADLAITLLKEPAVAARWDEPSALEDFNVGGLAVHLANQVFHIPQAQPAVGQLISLLENYARASWVGTDASFDVNIAIRRRSEGDAAAGVRPLIERATETLAEVKSVIAGAPADLVLHMPWTGWDLTFDDFLTTRLLELVVHSDDLAVSVDLPTPAIPESAATIVVDLLSRLAIRRHGPTAVIRALSRSERSPATISAL